MDDLFKDIFKPIDLNNIEYVDLNMSKEEFELKIEEIKQKIMEARLYDTENV